MLYGCQMPAGILQFTFELLENGTWNHGVLAVSGLFHRTGTGCVRTRVSRSVSVISTYRARSLLRLVSVLLAIFYFLPCCLFTLQLPTINQYRCVQPCCLFYKKKYVLSQAWC